MPELALVEKGYHDEDYDHRTVNLVEAENFAPSYLRINPTGTIPTLVVPLAETTGAEVDTKFRALSGSVAITEFLDSSRSQAILAQKGDENAKPAPVLSPATIEGKATSDALIALVHNPSADPNALLLAARSTDELAGQRKALQGTFCRNRLAALERHKAEAISSAGGENPRTAHMTEQLVKWYNDKIAELAPLHAAYLTDDQQAAQGFVQQSHKIWAGVVIVLAELERKLVLPFAIGDQISIADVHLIAWLARVMAVATAVEGDQDELAALEKALHHASLQGTPAAHAGVGEKVS